MSNTCLVTGGAGFIGCAISKLLNDHFDSVIAVDNLHPQIHFDRSRPNDLNSQVKLIEEDVTIPDTWDSIFKEFHPNTVIHLAAETGTGQSLTEASRHANVNVVGTTQMLDAMVRHQAIPKRIVLSSSRAVYGEGAWRDKAGKVTYPGQRGRAMLEKGIWDFPGMTCLPFKAGLVEARPTSIYGATKLTQEQILSAWCMSFGVEFPILRLQNVYGRGQSLSNPYTGIVSLFAQLARNKQIIPIYEDGLIIRDFVYITDVAEAIVSAASGHVSSGRPYDIGSGKPTSILELGNIISEYYGSPKPEINGRYRNGDVRHASCNIDSAEQDFGWIPKVSLRSGIEDLCEWLDNKSL